MDFESVKEEVQKAMSQKRFIHSCGVAKKAKELAMIFGEDENKAQLIGIAHDTAKEMSIEDSNKYVKNNNIEFDEIEKEEPALWHSKIGADICGKKFGFDDKMKQAIIYHTTGNVSMNLLDKIIYVADKIEENRTYEMVEEIRKIANNNIDEAVLCVTKRALFYSLRKNSLIHLDTIYLMNKLISENSNTK